VEKGYGRVNIIQILCTHVYNGKMIPVELFKEWRGRMKKDDGE
jgi:hypothetical protein